MGLIRKNHGSEKRLAYTYSQTRIKETHWALRKGFLLSIVSFISCPINVERRPLQCHNEEQ